MFEKEYGNKYAICEERVNTNLNRYFEQLNGKEQKKIFLDCNLRVEKVNQITAHIFLNKAY